MENKEAAKILRKESEEYRSIEGEHRELKESLAELNKKKFLTTEEEIKKKEMQKQKLLKKDRMAELIREYINKK